MQGHIGVTEGSEVRQNCLLRRLRVADASEGVFEEGWRAGRIFEPRVGRRPRRANPGSVQVDVRLLQLPRPGHDPGVLLLEVPILLVVARLCRAPQRAPPAGGLEVDLGLSATRLDHDVSDPVVHTAQLT